MTSVVEEKLPRDEIIRILTERYGYYCFLGNHDFGPEDEVTIDHWIPLAKNGTWDIENLRLACKRHNALKGDRMPNPDGTVPMPEPRHRGTKQPRPELCDTCNAGRNLGPEEVCEVCGSL